MKEIIRDSATFTKIILGAIAIISAIITGYLIPWLKSLFEEKELDKFIYYATVAVKFANQIYTPEQWREKKKAVTVYLQQVIADKIHIEITDDDLDKIIEGIVYEVKQEAAKGN